MSVQLQKRKRLDFAMPPRKLRNVVALAVQPKEGKHQALQWFSAASQEEHLGSAVTSTLLRRMLQKGTNIVRSDFNAACWISYIHCIPVISVPAMQAVSSCSYFGRPQVYTKLLLAKTTQSMRVVMPWNKTKHWRRVTVQMMDSWSAT